MPYVVDTDMGVDDWMALVYLYSRPVDVAAITVSGTGLAHGRPGAANLARLLATLGAPDVPIAYGPDHAVAPDSGHRFPERADWGRRATDGLAVDIAEHLVPVDAPPPDDDAPDLLVRTLERGPMDVVALGPLTNIALALADQPAIADNITSLSIMGGAVGAPGNAPGGIAEYNVWVDPVAADRVLRHPGLAGRIRLIPLDLTNQVPLTKVFADRVRGTDRNDPRSRAQIVAGLLDRPWVASATAEGEYFFWDSLALAVGTGRYDGAAGETADLAVDERTGGISRAPGSSVHWFDRYVPGRRRFDQAYIDAIAS